ncbi:unnamed protein product [Clonostachys chloroleuca]|uniref:Uncharacterized protein n=1 Tax=Clonostachys chloroleuca TaxID=1926264 RepID=A0AA35LYP3_9HYPO|nr:unnamed protein product [Clonostachys chloroleuca]
MSQVLHNNTEPPFGPIVNGTQIVFFEYRPNIGAAWAFVVLFAIAAAIHFGMLIWLRAWHFIPLTLGLIGEAFGYYGRVRAHSEPNIAGPFIMQNILILGCAPLIAATVYMTLARYIRVFDIRDRIHIPPRLMTFFFVLVDLGCFVTQVFGSAAPTSGDPQGVALGRTLIISGLITQLVALGLFSLILFISHRLAISESMGLKTTPITIFGSKYFHATYCVAGAMVVRSLVRGIEYLQGDKGFIIAHEIFIYLFDAAPMILVPVVYVFIHPGKLLRDAAKVVSDGTELARYEVLTS